MLILGAADGMGGGASVASQLTCTIWGMDLTTAGSVEDYKILDQRQLAASPAAIIGVPGAGHIILIKTIHIVNNDTTARTFQLFIDQGGTSVAAGQAITGVISIPAGGMAVYEDGQGWQVLNVSGELEVTVAAAVGQQGVSCVSADVANATTTVAAIADLDQVLTPGTYKFQYMIRYTAGATTTGVKFAVDHTGTVTFSVYNLLYVDTLATASSGAADQDANASTAQVYGAYAARADNVTLGPTLSVDSAGGEMLMIIDGLIKVTASGTLRLMHGSEVAATSTVKIGTSLVTVKTQ